MLINKGYQQFFINALLFVALLPIKNVIKASVDFTYDIMLFIFFGGNVVLNVKPLISTTIALAVLYGAQAHPFTREFNQDNEPGVFHEGNSSAELCLFVFSRQGALLIQPHCMVSSSSHNNVAVATKDEQ